MVVAPTPILHAEDAYAVHVRRQQNRIQTYLNVFARLCRRIQSTTQLDRLEMIYRVPWFVPGCPLYIVSVCMVFLIIKLRRYGYTVRPIAEDRKSVV